MDRIEHVRFRPAEAGAIQEMGEFLTRYWNWLLAKGWKLVATNTRLFMGDEIWDVILSGTEMSGSPKFEDWLEDVRAEGERAVLEGSAKEEPELYPYQRPKFPQEVLCFSCKPGSGAVVCDPLRIDTVRKMEQQVKKLLRERGWEMDAWWLRRTSYRGDQRILLGEIAIECYKEYYHRGEDYDLTGVAERLEQQAVVK